MLPASAQTHQFSYFIVRPCICKEQINYSSCNGGRPVLVAIIYLSFSACESVLTFLAETRASPMRSTQLVAVETL